MKNVLLTIIVPIYNKEDLLKQCLDSFANKEFVGCLEVLAIDDGSVDNSLSIALEYSNRYPEIYRVIQKKNGGVGSVMNLGLQYAMGKYIKEVDADDYIDADALKNLLHFLENCNSDIVITPFEDVDGSGNHIKSHFITGLKYGQEYLLDRAYNKLEICIQSLIVRKDLLTEKNFRFEETRYYVDMQLVCESIYYAETCVVLKDILYFYRLNQSEQSVSLKSYVKNKESFSRQVLLSLKRYLCGKANRSLSDFRRNICRKWAYVYSSMLYIIYLMDKSQKSNTECREFDLLLEKEYPEIYFETGKNTLVQELRKENFKNIEGYKAKIAKTIEDLQGIGKKALSLGELCSLELDGSDSFALYKLQKQRDKQSILFRLLNQWLMNYQNGIRIENYLLAQGFHKIAIYGCGMLGDRLYQELIDSGVEVAYGIDQRGTAIIPNLQIYRLQDCIKEVDGIIVTVIPEFSEIRRSLKEKVTCPIISLEDVIYRS